MVGDSQPYEPAPSGESEDAFLSRLSAGPDNAELAALEFARLEAWLKRPLSLAEMRAESMANSGGRRSTRAKLKQIRNYNVAIRKLHADGKQAGTAERHISFDLPAIVAAVSQFCIAIRARCPLKNGPPVQTGNSFTFDSDVVAYCDLAKLSRELRRLLNPDGVMRMLLMTSGHISTYAPADEWHALNLLWEAYMGHFEPLFEGFSFNLAGRTWIPGRLPEIDAADLDRLERAADVVDQCVKGKVDQCVVQPLKTEQTPETRGLRQPTVSSAEKPDWDISTRTLSYSGFVVKVYAKRATRQMAILEAFQIENWPREIDNPITLKGQSHRTLSERTNDAIKGLNDRQENRLLRFGTCGGGTTIYWEPVRPEEVEKRPKTP